MQIINTKYSLLIFLISLSFHLYGQNSSDEGPLWESRNGLLFELKATKNLDFTIEQQVRFKSVGKLYDEALTEIGVQYEVFDRLTAGISYRYIRSLDDKGKKQGLETHHRLHYNLSYKYNLDRIKLGARVQYQTKDEQPNPEPGEPSEPWEKNWRLKLESEYNIKNWKLDPEGGFEYFISVGNEERTDKYRLFLGTTYKLPGPHEIGLKYLFENSIHCDCNDITNMIYIRYKYTLDLD